MTANRAYRLHLWLLARGVRRGPVKWIVDRQMRRGVAALRQHR